MDYSTAIQNARNHLAKIAKQARSTADKEEAGFNLERQIIGFERIYHYGEGCAIYDDKIQKTIDRLQTYAERLREEGKEEDRKELERLEAEYQKGLDKIIDSEMAERRKNKQ